MTLPLEQSQPLGLQKWNLSFLSYKVGLLEVGLFLIHLRGWESERKWAQSFLFREMKMFCGDGCTSINTPKFIELYTLLFK